MVNTYSHKCHCPASHASQHSTQQLVRTTKAVVEVPNYHKATADPTRRKGPPPTTQSNNTTFDYPKQRHIQWNCTVPQAPAKAYWGTAKGSYWLTSAAR